MQEWTQLIWRLKATVEAYTIDAQGPPWPLVAGADAASVAGQTRAETEPKCDAETSVPSFTAAATGGSEAFDKPATKAPTGHLAVAHAISASGVSSPDADLHVLRTLFVSTARIVDESDEKSRHLIGASCLSKTAKSS